jgi:tetratricopeptide (TPR) repeat protein
MAPTLALVLIARNEQRCIARCLESVRPWVDDMVVLDTGSTDDTMAIARACGARVFEAPWPNDFSAARNLSLDLSLADWNLILDADEWIASGAECLREAIRHPQLGVVCQRSEFVVDGVASTANAWISRLLPRGVRYAGAVHEQPVSTLPRTQLPLILGHDGYSPAQNAAKKGRNRALLESMLASDPANAYVHYQLGKDFEIYGEATQACDAYLQALALHVESSGYDHDLLIRTLHCLGQCGRVDEAIILAEQSMDAWQDSPDFFFALGNLFLDKAQLQPEEALQHWLPMAEAAWTRCLEIGERPGLTGAVAGRGSHLAAHNLAVVLEGMGHREQAAHYRHLFTGSDATLR